MIDPAEASEEDTLTCVAEGATDPDGQDVEWHYVWVVNGAQLQNESASALESGAFGSGDSVTCIATPTDGLDAGEALTSSNTVSIANTLPTPPTLALDPEEGNAKHSESLLFHRVQG